MSHQVKKYKVVWKTKLGHTLKTRPLSFLEALAARSKCRAAGYKCWIEPS